ncbi:hypothetical protein JTE90_006602 [Oedothorax gibbosus]|uniref:Shugoshin C-terminal domain-containing protein n=1 Tax=Oedothorax gibbosus TaxID=931172 RepID=A0AAV6U419_9ARAC|nr:hypothetical protein JTE90_006602 [Oedothorax gibbosus]
MSCQGPDLHVKPLLPPKPTKIITNPHLHRIQSNCMMLDLRKQVQWQSQVIRDLKTERDRLTQELASRLFFVEAQLKREQKHIEALLSEKDQYIRFQDLQIESLKCVLSQVDWDYRRQQQNAQRGRSMSSSARRSSNNSKPQQAVPPPSLSKRYSVALDEYMKDNGIVSRAQPVVVTAAEKECPPRSRCARALSLPELRLNNGAQQGPLGPDQCYGPYENFSQSHGISQGVIDELAARRWTSDCDSETSDSLDSGISSPSIQSRSMYLDDPVNFSDNYSIKSSGSIPTRRGSSIGNFLNRKFSFSSNHLEKLKDDHHRDEDGVCPTARRHGSFSGVNCSNEIDQESGLHQRICEEQKPKKFISSANRTFGTNHRSVMKPRDIKFKKLFKFRRRTEPVDQDMIHCEDFMTV